MVFLNNLSKIIINEEATILFAYSGRYTDIQKPLRLDLNTYRNTD